MKADGTMSLVKSARSIIFFDTGLPTDKAFILEGLTENSAQIYVYFSHWLLQMSVIENG